MKKQKVLYVMYSITESICDDYVKRTIKLHGIFTDKQVSKHYEDRKRARASCMIVPLNKFIDVGIEL